ncbi:uncharacterized protein LOC121861384 isoform X2 [Homarus americanus]|uniref:uncharacterized protein LOC121861384 isoform X2 n=1 Tax=Homarus americanus TaxID=6706 RepID=UPI001C480A38|nr:uncharacterized protein LOC121861384 isoform X2 [Homarus americanus]
MGRRRSTRDDDGPEMGRRRSTRNDDVPEMGRRRSTRDNDVPEMGRRRSTRDDDVPEMGRRRSTRDDDGPEMGRRRSTRNDDVPEMGRRRSTRDDDVPEMGRRRSTREDDITDLGRRRSTREDAPYMDLQGLNTEDIPNMERRPSIKKKIQEMEHRKSMSEDMAALEHHLSTNENNGNMEYREALDADDEMIPEQMAVPKIQVHSFSDLVDENSEDAADLDERSLKLAEPYLKYRKSISELEPYLQFQDEVSKLTPEIQAQWSTTEAETRGSLDIQGHSSGSNCPSDDENDEPNNENRPDVADGLQAHMTSILSMSDTEPKESDNIQSSWSLTGSRDSINGKKSQQTRDSESEAADPASSGSEGESDLDVNWKLGEPVPNLEYRRSISDIVRGGGSSGESEPELMNYRETGEGEEEPQHPDSRRSSGEHEPTPGDEPRKSIGIEMLDSLVHQQSSEPIPAHKSPIPPDSQEDDAQWSMNETPVISAADMGVRSPRGSTAGLDTRSPRGSTAGLDTRSPRGSTAGLDTRSPRESTAGLESGSPRGSIADLEAPSPRESATFLETGETELAVSEEPRRKSISMTVMDFLTSRFSGVQEAQDSPAPQAEVQDSCSEVCGLTEGSASDQEVHSPRGSTAGLDTRSPRGSTAGLDTRSPRGSTAGLDTRSPRGSTAGLDTRSPRGSTAGLDTRSPRGSTAGLESGSPRGSTAGLDTRSPRGSTAGSEDQSPGDTTALSESHWPPRGSNDMEDRRSSRDSVDEDHKSRKSSVGALEGRISPRGSVGALEGRISPRGSVGTLEGRISPRGSVGVLEGRISPRGSVGALEGRISPRGSVGALEGRISPRGSVGALEGRILPGGSVGALEGRISPRGSVGALEGRISPGGSVGALEGRISPRGSVGDVKSHRSPRGSTAGLDDTKTYRKTIPVMNYPGEEDTDWAAESQTKNHKSVGDAVPGFQGLRSFLETAQNGKSNNELFPVVTNEPRKSIGMEMFNYLVRRFSNVEPGQDFEPERPLERDAQKSPRASFDAKDNRSSCRGSTSDLDANRSPRGSRSDLDNNRSPRGSRTDLDANRSPRGSRTDLDANRSPRGSRSDLNDRHSSEKIVDNISSNEEELLDSVDDSGSDLETSWTVNKEDSDSKSLSRYPENRSEIQKYSPVNEMASIYSSRRGSMKKREITEYYQMDIETGDLYYYEAPDLFTSLFHHIMTILCLPDLDMVEYELPLPSEDDLGNPGMMEDPSELQILGEKLMQCVKRLDGSEGWTTMDNIQKDKIKKKLESITAVTFCGCGFLGGYLVGAATYIQEHAPGLLRGRLGGSSVGSLIATCIVCDVPLQAVRETILKTAKASRAYLFGPLSPFFPLEEPLLKNLLKMLPEDAHIRASGRLFLSLTRASTLTNEVVSEYKTRDELVRAVLCCCFLPGISGFSAPTFQGRRYVDGGMSNNMPLKGPTTLSINVFAGEFDISPDEDDTNYGPTTVFNQTLEMSMENLRKFYLAIVPPESEELDVYYDRGYADARKYITGH